MNQDRLTTKFTNDVGNLPFLGGTGYFPSVGIHPIGIPMNVAQISPALQSSSVLHVIGGLVGNILGPGLGPGVGTGGGTMI